MRVPRTRPFLLETGTETAPAGTNERAARRGLQPCREETSDGGRSDDRTLAEIIGAVSAALVADDKSKAVTPPGERAGSLQAAMGHGGRLHAGAATND